MIKTCDYCNLPLDTDMGDRWFLIEYADGNNDRYDKVMCEHCFKEYYFELMEV